MIRLALIRHGKTQGNLEGRYVGVTDEALCQEGRLSLTQMCQEDLTPLAQMKPQAVYSSPMKRCLETAGILFEEKEVEIIPEFRETDFGVFEYKNYEELNGNPVYQAWIDSNGTMDIPEAEDTAAFTARIERGLAKLYESCLEKGYDQVSCVVHGGVIMKLMNLYGVPQEDYYYWQVKNGRGLVVDYDGHQLIYVRHI